MSEACPNCNGNRHYQSGDRTVWCHVCEPARALGQERIADCKQHHRDVAMKHWAGERIVAWVVTLVGKRKGKVAKHAYHVTAATQGGAIRTAIANDFILEGKSRVGSVRLCCPCDAGGWR